MKLENRRQKVTPLAHFLYRLGLSGIVAFIYSVISKLVVGKSLLLTPMIIMPFVSFTASFIILLIGNALVGGTTDYLNLQIFFFLNGISSIAYILLISNFSIKHHSS